MSESSSDALVFFGATGDLAYKMKKPVNLGYLDFTSLEKRRSALARELTLNARTAPDTTKGVEASRRELEKVTVGSGGVLLHLETEGASGATWARVEGVLDRLWVAVFQPTSPEVRSEQVEVAERGGAILRPN